MSDRMTPIPFGKLMNWIFEEHKKGSVFGVRRPFVADPKKTYEIFGKMLETPFGPAAGPHTQLAQNIVAAYVAGSRFFELKTVQKLDGEDLPVSKPCIKADDECYNCEWSTELYVPQAFDEYVKAWFVCHVLAKEYGLGGQNGFQFNMSVGYDLDGIKTEKIDRFIEGLKDASETPIFAECKQWLLDHVDAFEHLTREDIEAIPAQVSNCITLSTLHGCPPQEIERIARYLIEEKKVHTFIKCNPTLLGYEYARNIMDEMGYDYVAFGDFHFKDDLQYEDAVPMLERLQALADEKGLEFGVKITNTFPVDVKAKELPSEEMYMSGKSLYPLSMSVAQKLANDFGGKLRISYSGGADFFNIKDIVDAGIWPVTMATTMLKPGGYERLEQIGQIFAKEEPKAFTGVDAQKVGELVEAVKSDRHHVKAVKPLPSRKIKRPVPLTDCFVAPCEEGCPIHQDITAYLKLMGAGKAKEALEVILEKNPLPFITGTICAHNCMSKCTRNFYETAVNIRRTKLEAAEGGFEAVMADVLKKPEQMSGKRAAVVGGGPAGMAAAYFLAKGGVETVIFEKEARLGGVVRNVIPQFRISHEAIDRDEAILKAVGAEVVTNTAIANVADLKKDYDYVILALGASTPGKLHLEEGTAMNALEFLAQFKATDGKVDLGENVVVIGGGNTAMDTARAAKRNQGVKKVSLVYRRTKRYMPADAEELELAIADGVEFAELLAPVKLTDGQLVCRKMMLGEMDESGRRGVVETDEIVCVPADTVIAAVGEKVPTSFYEANAIAVDARGRVQVTGETLETSIPGVYAVGDGLYGPATVVEGIRDAMKAADAILAIEAREQKFTLSDAETIYARKGKLDEEDTTKVDSRRCLSCNSYCENCVEVCPNRANISLVVPGMERHQIIHVDYMCNECGNCKSFCPWESAPYLDKFTLFATEKDMMDSRNQGFVVLNPESGDCKVRLKGLIGDYRTGEKSDFVPENIGKIIATVIRDYAYLLLR